MQATSLASVLLLTLIAALTGSAVAETAGLSADPTGGWMGLFSNAPLAGALIWIFSRVMDRDKEREENLLQREREREAAAAKRDEGLAARDSRISDALTALSHSLDNLSINCRLGRNDRAP